MRLRALTVFIFIVLLISACTSGSNNGGSDSSAGNTPGTTTETPTNSNETPDGSQGQTVKYDPPIEVTTVKKAEPTITFAEGESYDNNVWTQAYLERYGIKIKNNWVVSGDQLDQRMNLMLATGDIPDFFQVNEVQFNQLVEADLIQELTEYYDNAPESVKNLLTEGGMKPLQAATVNGKLMGIPFTVNSKENARVMWVRQDWLDALGLPAPETMADLLAVSKAFAEQDPDGNGVADTYGIAFANDLSTVRGFMNGYHAQFGMWVQDDNGGLVYSDIQPEMKNALRTLQELYQAKQIDPEFTVKNYDKVAESLAAGQAGIFFEANWAGTWPLQLTRDNNPNAVWQAYPIVSVDNQLALAQVDTKPQGYWVVRKGFEHPEAIFYMMEFWTETFYLNMEDEIQETYVSTPDGQSPWLLNQIAAYRTFRNADAHKHVMEVLDGKRERTELTPAERGILANIEKYQAGDNSFWGFNANFGPGGSLSVIQQYIAKDQFIENEFFVSPTPTMTERISTLNSLRDEVFTKIIVGEASIDAFDQFVTDWNAGGGAQITTEVNEWYSQQ